MQGIQKLQQQQPAVQLRKGQTPWTEFFKEAYAVNQNKQKSSAASRELKIKTAVR